MTSAIGIENIDTERSTRVVFGNRKSSTSFSLCIYISPPPFYFSFLVFVSGFSPLLNYVRSWLPIPDTRNVAYSFYIILLFILPYLGYRLYLTPFLFLYHSIYSIATRITYSQLFLSHPTEIISIYNSLLTSSRIFPFLLHCINRVIALP